MFGASYLVRFIGRTTARRLARYISRDFFRRIRGSLGSYVDDFLASESAEEFGQAIIAASIVEAIGVMSTMVVNAGMESIFEDYVVPAFEGIEISPEDCDPEQVYNDIPAEYLEFMSDMVSEGVSIVEAAKEEALEIAEFASLSGVKVGAGMSNQGIGEGIGGGEDFDGEDD